MKVVWVVAVVVALAGGVVRGQGVLLCFDNQGGRVNWLAIDPGTGATAVLRVAAEGAVAGLDYDPGLRALVSVAGLPSVGVAAGDLVRVDTAGFVLTSVAPTGLSTVAGFAVDRAAVGGVGGVVYYAYDQATRRVHVVDPVTGAASAVSAEYTAGVVSSMAFDPVRGELFLVDFFLDALLRVDPEAGPDAPFVRVGSLGVAGTVTGLAFDDAGTLYAIDSGRDELLTIDAATGAASVVGAAGIGSPRSLAWVPGAGMPCHAGDVALPWGEIDAEDGLGVVRGVDAGRLDVDGDGVVDFFDVLAGLRLGGC